MKILDRLPIPDRPHLITVQGEVAEVYRNQIIVWVSIKDVLRPFPAILDTGHSHNFSITERQLQRWTGQALKRIGELEISKEPVVQYTAEVRIHRNVPGKTERTGDAYLLEMPQGISVIPNDHEAAPRLPLLGLRTIISNKLKLIIDGESRKVSLKTKGWF
jgi:hypothetical protein